jgi:WD40 repeat protein
MARLRRDCIVQLTALVALAWAAPALAQEADEAGPTGLYDRPTLVLDPGMHTALISRADVDAAGRYAVTGSDDKTVRVWSVEDGRPLQTIRLPAGPGDVGKVNAVALSPNGDLIAAGGWTRWTEPDPQEQIYLFERATGSMVGRIEGLPVVVTQLTFSADGRHLAATLGAVGLRVFDRYDGWAEVARDTDYADGSYGADFSVDGRLATTSWDGHVRLYDRRLQLVAKERTRGGQHPVGIAFSPDGTMVAVGYTDSTAVDLLDGQTLSALPSPDTDEITNGNLSKVAWSADGGTLFAGGRYIRGDWISPVVAWAHAGAGARRELPASSNTIMSLVALPKGDLLVAAGDPYLTVLDPEGHARWTQTPRQADFRGQVTTLAVSLDGQTVDFGYQPYGRAPARFDVTTRSLQGGTAADGETAPPEQKALPIENWLDTFSIGPTLDGTPLSLEAYETSRSLAIHPKHDRFVLGTEWGLRAYDAQGELLWRQAVPGTVWAVNISGDGRLVVAASGDGTIRWHRMEDGSELLAFFPLADRTNWVAWTPDGFYAATPGAHGILRWHVNHGWHAPGEAIPVSDIAELRRPEVLPLMLQEMDIVQALGIAELNEARLATQRRLNSTIKPGTQLHVLAVGVGDYNEENAKGLRLEFADEDAWDVASALFNTQGSLYANVNPQILRNGEATRAGISRALDTIQKTMQQDDVAVFHFSGHGALVGDALYLLPYEVDTRDPAGIEGSAIEIGALRKKLVQLAERGRVLVLLDACRSGAITEDGADTTVDASQLRAVLAAANVTVLTSSSGKENSIEHERWQNGAFTQVFLEALGQDADSDRNSVVSMTELTRYVTAGVPRLVHDVDPVRQQTPGVEMRFEHTIFAAGL